MPSARIAEDHVEQSAKQHADGVCGVSGLNHGQNLPATSDNFAASRSP
jgi:hypothetical protein